MKRTPLRKETKRPLGKLKKEAWRVFSIYIRQKYADENGNVQCFTCGDVKHWKQMQAGHYVSRSCNSLMFDEYNVHPQCLKDNIFKHGHMDAYALHLTDAYGQDILKYLAKKKLIMHPFTREELHTIIDTCNNKLRWKDGEK